MVLEQNTILLLVAFVIIVFLVYKIFRILVKTMFAGAAGFAFPYVVDFLNLPIPIEATLQTGTNFALAAIGLLLICELSHFIIYFFKLLTWPARALFKRRKK